MSVYQKTVVLTGSIAQVLFGGLPNILGWEHTIGSQSAESQTLVVPATYAFSIWSVIFLGCIVYAIIQALPKHRDDQVFQQTGWFIAAAFWGNALWEVYVPPFGFDVISVLIIVGILSVLIVTLFRLKQAGDTRPVFYPIYLLAGWISVAALVNISVASNYLDFNPFHLSPYTQGVIILISAGSVAVIGALVFRSVFYNFSILWGLTAIYVINQARQETALANLALALGILGFVLAIGAILYQRKKGVSLP